jgi:hypothetical protein
LKLEEIEFSFNDILGRSRSLDLTENPQLKQVQRQVQETDSSKESKRENTLQRTKSEIKHAEEIGKVTTKIILYRTDCKLYF